MTTPRPTAALLALAATALLWGGCATSYTLRVDALRADRLAATGPAFELGPGPALAGGDALLFEAALPVLRGALATAGLTAPAPGAPIRIEADFGVGPARTEIRTVSEPVYAWVGGGSDLVRTVQTDANGQSKTVVTRVHRPARRELVDWYERAEGLTVFDKYLRLSAFNRQGEPLWRVSVKTGGPGDDFREFLPVLAAAAAPYIGQDSGRQVSLTLRADDPRVLALRPAGAPPR